MDNDGEAQRCLARPERHLCGFEMLDTVNKPHLDLASERLPQLMHSIESLDFLGLHGHEGWTHPYFTWSVQDRLLLGNMQSLRRLNFVGCHGLVRNPKEFLDPLRSSKSLKTIGVCINADPVLDDRFLPHYTSYHFRDEPRQGSKAPMSVVLQSDRTSLAYVRTLCDLFEEKRWEI